jgi:hypothetical protein
VETNEERVTCPGCGARYSARALRCPACADPNPRGTLRRLPVNPVVFLLVGILVLAVAVAVVVYSLWR